MRNSKMFQAFSHRLKRCSTETTGGGKSADQSGKRAAEVTGTITYDRFTRKMELHLDLDCLRDIVDGGKP